MFSPINRRRFAGAGQRAGALRDEEWCAGRLRAREGDGEEGLRLRGEWPGGLNRKSFTSSFIRM